MDYIKHYMLLIEKATNRQLNEYVEEHHVVPKCIGGKDEEDNIVKLTPEEHYVAHQLLVKMYPNNDELVFAAAMMVANRPGNKLYGWLRRKRNVLMKKLSGGKNNSQYGSVWITNGTENKKIKRSDAVPVGWKLGRVIASLPKKIRCCPACKNEFVSNRKRKYCSRKCFNADNLKTVSVKVSAARRGKPRTTADKEKISMGMKKFHIFRQRRMRDKYPFAEKPLDTKADDGRTNAEQNTPLGLGSNQDS